MPLDIDKIIPKDTSLGAYDVIIVAMATYVMIISACNIMAPNYLTPHIEHRCDIPQLEVLPDHLMEMFATPWDWSHMDYSSCEEYDIDWSALDLNFTDRKDITWWDLPYVNTTESRTCRNGWVYELETYGPTATSEWDLVCSRSWLLQLLPPMSLVGMFIGSLVCGSIANRVGRRRAIVLFEVGLVVCGTIASFSPAPEMLLCLRFLVGVFAASSLVVACVFITEVMPARWRVLMVGIVNSGYGLGMILLSACAFFIHHFRYLQLTLSILGLPIISFLWFLPESPRWLNSVGRVEEAARELADICRRNKRTIPENLLFVATSQKSVTAEIHTESTNTGGYHDLLRHPVARKYLFIISMCWTTASFVFMGVSLNITGLFGDPYINGVISGAVEVTAILLAAASLQRVGRKPAMMTLLGIIAAAGFIPVPLQVLDVYPEVSTVCAVLSRSTASATFLALFVFAGELFPTSVRSAAVGIAVGVGYIVSLVAPFACGPAVSVFFPWLPNVLYGTMSVITATMTSGLVETLGHDLPDTLEDVERLAGESPLKNKSDFDAEESAAATNLGFFDEGIFEYQDLNRNPTASFSFYLPGYRPDDGVFTAAKDSECISRVPVRDCIDTNRFSSYLVTRM